VEKIGQGEVFSGLVLQVGERDVLAGIAEVEGDPIDAGPHVLPLRPGFRLDVGEARATQQAEPVDTPPARQPGVGGSWTLETGLDVEWAHAMAPMANIIDVTTNPAETEGVQGLPATMDAEQRQDDRGHHYVPDYPRELGHRLRRADGVAETDVRGLVNQYDRPRAEKRRYGRPGRGHQPAGIQGQQKC